MWPCLSPQKRLSNGIRPLRVKNLEKEVCERWHSYISANDKEVEVEKLLKKFERYIVIGLLAMMALVVFLSTVELAVIIVERMLTGKPKLFLLDISDMLEIFGFFMMILI